ncbi:hypothetical protein [Nocardia sp. NPDC004860]|uniref:hypothetical protein n=1 Tax=Nocardia sp. NPDC004860 TaxID=3154557 RepID=UPI0033A459DC
MKGQTEQAWCPTLAANAVIAWTTEYYGLAVEQMRRSRGSFPVGVQQVPPQGVQGFALVELAGDAARWGSSSN